MRSLLFDTCALIWVAENAPITEAAVGAIREVVDAGGRIAVSPMTAWEIGMLAARGRLAMSMEPKAWFERLIARPDICLAGLSPTILIDSSTLPGEPPRDPVDRIVISTARANDFTIITRDQLILNYAAAGHAKAIAC